MKVLLAHFFWIIRELGIFIYVIVWFYPAAKPHLAACSLSPGGMEERFGSVKVRKHLGWDEQSFLEKAKATHTSKVIQRIDSLLPIIRQVFSHLQESWAPSHITVIWINKHHHSKQLPPLLLLPPASYAEHVSIWYGISLWSLRVTCPGVPSQLLLHSHTPCWWGDMRGRKGLGSGWVLLRDKENIPV